MNVIIEKIYFVFCINEKFNLFFYLYLIWIIYYEKSCHRTTFEVYSMVYIFTICRWISSKRMWVMANTFMIEYVLECLFENVLGRNVLSLFVLPYEYIWKNEKTKDFVRRHFQQDILDCYWLSYVISDTYASSNT